MKKKKLFAKIDKKLRKCYHKGKITVQWYDEIWYDLHDVYDRKKSKKFLRRCAAKLKSVINK